MFILVHSKPRATSSLLRTLRKSTKQSQLDHLHNNQENDLEHLKKHTLLGQHNTKIADLDPLKNTQPILANTETKLVFTEYKDYICYRRLSEINTSKILFHRLLINHTLLAIKAL